MLFVYLIPGALLFIPMYLIIVRLGLLDTYTGLILANIAFGVPFCTWLMMGYLRSLSAEMEYAAMIDGCTRIQAMWYIVIPLSIPAIVTAGIFTFNNVWNEFIFALILTQKEAYRMISVGLSNFYRTDYYMVGPMMAGSLIAVAPVVHPLHHCPALRGWGLGRRRRQGVDRAHGRHTAHGPPTRTDAFE